MNQTLIFVYNADSGFMNGIFDFFHKIARPSTYACSLCMITYNYKGMRNAWKGYLESLPVETAFYHKDQLTEIYPDLASFELPAVFLESNTGTELIVSSNELKELDLQGLMQKLSAAINAD